MGTALAWEDSHRGSLFTGCHYRSPSDGMQFSANNVTRGERASWFFSLRQVFDGTRPVVDIREIYGK